MKLKNRKPINASKPEPAPLQLLAVDAAQFVGGDVLAGIVGLTDRRIRQLAGQGILTRAGRGHYPWPAVVEQYCNYLRSGGEGSSERLKNRELELKCKRLEQVILTFEERRRDEIAGECWEEVQDFLAEYKSELVRLPFDADQLAVLNNALDKAIANVDARKAAVVSSD